MESHSVKLQIGMFKILRMAKERERIQKQVLIITEDPVCDNESSEMKTKAVQRTNVRT